MKKNAEYRFSGGRITVRVVDIYRQGGRRYVDFYSVHNGNMVGERRTVLYSYAKKNWIPA